MAPQHAHWMKWQFLMLTMLLVVCASFARAALEDDFVSLPPELASKVPARLVFSESELVQCLSDTTAKRCILKGTRHAAAWYTAWIDEHQQQGRQQQQQQLLEMCCCRSSMAAGLMQPLFLLHVSSPDKLCCSRCVVSAGISHCVSLAVCRTHRYRQAGLAGSVPKHIRHICDWARRWHTNDIIW